MGLFSQIVPESKGPQELNLKLKVNSVYSCLHFQFTLRTIKIKHIRLVESKEQTYSVMPLCVPAQL